MIDTKVIREKFFVDPDWKNVEQMIMDYVNPLMEMKDIDITQPAEHIKAEVIGRTMIYDQMCKFLEATGFVGNVKNYQKTNQFK